MARRRKCQSASMEFSGEDEGDSGDEKGRERSLQPPLVVSPSMMAEKPTGRRSSGNKHSDSSSSDGEEMKKRRRKEKR